MSSLQNEDNAGLNMKKQLVIIGIIVLLITVGLSGCNENTNGNITPKSKEIEIVSHNIEDAGWLGWRVYGTIKNIADRNIDTVTITVRFYDKDNDLLIIKETKVYYLAKGNTDDFEVRYQTYEKYFDQYDHYTVSTYP